MSMNIIRFEYEKHEARTILDENGNPWFAAKDWAEILGYVNTNDAINRHCKGVVKHYPLQTPGGTQQVRIINEPDLYRLIVHSTLEASEKFEAWVFEEVLPTIRKTGRYSAPNVQPSLADLAERLTNASKSPNTSRLPAAETWDIASTIVSALFGIDAMQLLGQKEVAGWEFARPGGTWKGNHHEDIPIIVYGHCKADNKDRMMFSQSAMFHFMDNFCEVKAGVAAPERDLYESFKVWLAGEIDFRDDILRGMFHDMLTRGWYGQNYRFMEMTIAGETWWLGIKPRQEQKKEAPPPSTAVVLPNLNRHRLAITHVSLGRNNRKSGKRR